MSSRFDQLHLARHVLKVHLSNERLIIYIYIYKINYYSNDTLVYFVCHDDISSYNKSS